MWFSKLDWVCPAVAFNFQALLASFFLQYVWLAIFNGNIYIYCCSFLSSWGLSVSFIISSIPPNILNHYFAVLKNKKKIITKEEITPSFIATGISFVSFFCGILKAETRITLFGSLNACKMCPYLSICQSYLLQGTLLHLCYFFLNVLICS